jgi:hypothetical protein
MALDPAVALPKLIERGFTLRSFPAYPRSLGAVRDNFVALLEATAQGEVALQGASGFLIGEKIAVLVDRDGRKVFQAKSEEVAATAALLESYQRFQADLKEVLRA